MPRFIRNLKPASVAVGAGTVIALMLLPVVSTPIINGVVFLRKKVGLVK